MHIKDVVSAASLLRGRPPNRILLLLSLLLFPAAEAIRLRQNDQVGQEDGLLRADIHMNDAHSSHNDSNDWLFAIQLRQAASLRLSHCSISVFVASADRTCEKSRIRTSKILSCLNDGDFESLCYL